MIADRPNGRRLLWLVQRARKAGLRPMTLGQLEDSGRPLLFSLLPRMLRADGGTPQSLQGAFEYVDQRRGRPRAATVSGQRWSRALATSRRLAARRATRGGGAP